MRKVNFVPKFILINFIARFILTCCFESIWGRLTTSTWSDWMNLLLLLIPSHMQKTNFITQLILEIKLAHYLSSLWLSPGMPDHTHLRQPINICYFRGPLVRSENSSSYLNLFVRYSSLMNPAFWLALRFLDHNSRNRFFPNVLFLQKVRRPLKLSYWAHLNFFTKTGIRHFSNFMMSSFIEKIEKNWWSWDLALQTNGKMRKPKFIGHFLVGWMSNSFAPRRHYGLSVAVWWYILVRLLVELFVSQGLMQAETTISTKALPKDLPGNNSVSSYQQLPRMYL